jgi:glutamate dehydrogenase
LRQVTDEVARQVLADCHLHARQVSLDVVRSHRDAMRFSPVINWVCGRSGVSRNDLNLPSNEDLLNRMARGKGLTRPELAVLAAHVKMHVYKALLADDPAHIPGFHDLVLAYFPGPIRERFGDGVRDHLLYRELGMNAVLTRVVADSGAAFFPTLLELTGASEAQIAGAWFHAMELVGGVDIRRQLEECSSHLDDRYVAWVAVNDAVQNLVALWLAPGERGPSAGAFDRIREVLELMSKLRGTADDERVRAQADELVARKIPTGIANRVANLADLTLAREIAVLHREPTLLDQGVVHYMAIGEASRLLPAIRAIDARKATSRWDPVALGILRNRYVLLLRRLVGIAPLGPEVRLGVDRVARRLTQGGRPLEALKGEMDRILGKEPDVPTLLVAEERVRAQVARFEAGLVRSGEASAGR